MILHEKNSFLRGEVIKNSVRNFRYLSSFTVTAPETETIPLNSHSGVGLNLDLAKTKCALLRSKISDGASVLGVLGVLGVLVITPCKALGPKAPCFVTEIFRVIFESVQPPLNLHVSAVVPAIRPLCSPDPLPSPLPGPSSLLSSFQKEFSEHKAHSLLYSLKVSLAPNTEE